MKFFPVFLLVPVLLINALAGGLGRPGVFEELPRAFASAHKGEIVGGSRDLFLTAAGQRALAADFAVVDMLVYYGSHHDEDEPEDGGHYLDLLPLTKRALALDPYFRYAAFYGGASLAFNEGRDEEAAEVLEEAKKRDPKHWAYPLLLSAIAYKKSGELGKIVGSLEPLLQEPDCPTVLKNILANFYFKTGEGKKGVRLLLEIAEKAPEREYREIALNKLRALEVLK